MSAHPTKVLQDIVDVLDGTEWGTETLDEIATILREAGYQIRDIDERDQDAPEEVECFECDRTFIAYRDESVCPDCIEIMSINRAHA